MTTPTLTPHNLDRLAIDMVQQANSGHPGAPIGMAPMAHTVEAVAAVGRRVVRDGFRGRVAAPPAPNAGSTD